MNDDSAEIARMKAEAAGPVGEQLSKFPLRFSKGAFFGERPSKERPTTIRNGPVTFIDLGDGPLGVTCAHVIEAYRNLKDRHGDVVFQIGNVSLDPLDQLLSINAELDLATLRLSEEQIAGITDGGEIGSCVFKPVEWPSPQAEAGESVVFGGFPEALRETPSFDEVVLASWSCGGTQVTTTNNDYFTCQFDREYWVASFGEEYHIGISSLLRWS